MPAGEYDALSGLEAEVSAELDMSRAGRPQDEIGQNPAEWLYDPVEAERDEIGLRNILGAVTAMEAGPQVAGELGDPAAEDPLGG